MTEPRPPIDISPITIPMPEAPVDWAEVFGNDRPVEIEVGSGKGLFLLNAAEKAPGRNFLGIEMARKYARQAAERIARKAVPNVKILPGDARRFLERFVPESSVRAVHIYFPDPWWKTRHRKRRVFCEAFVIDVARILLPDGDFSLATDVEEYFGVMQRILADHPDFAATPWAEPQSPEHDADYLTNFERKYRIEGRPIHRASYKKLSGMSS